MLSPETNATTNATAEETNATAEAQMPDGRVKRWTTKDNQFLLGAATAAAGGAGSIVALAAAAAIVPPDEPPNVTVNIDQPPPVDPPLDDWIRPEILEHAQENAVTIYSVIVDESGEIIRAFGHGSGFFIEGTEGRLIGTAAHVVEPPDLGGLPEGATVQNFVRIDDGELEGTVISVEIPSDPAVDAVNDLAILDIGEPTPGYPGIAIAPPGSAELGEPLWSVGTPLDTTLEGTVRQVAVGSLEGQRVDGQETGDVIQVDGIIHRGQSGSLLIDSEGRLVGILTHGGSGSPLFPEGNELTISFATKSERLAELLEQYLASPEYLDPDTSVVLPGADTAAFQEWIDEYTLGPAPEDIYDGVVPFDDVVPGSGLVGTEDIPNVLIIGDKESGFGPWGGADSPPDDGGVIDSILEILEAAT